MHVPPNHAENQADLSNKPTLADMMPIDSRAVWLSVEDISDCRLDSRTHLLALDWIGYAEAVLFQNQLFYWLLSRSGRQPIFVLAESVLRN